MPITVSYDLANADNNQRTYVRSMLERFGWRRLGGSVFRYPSDNRDEDWLNEVVPALMFFRSYVCHHRILVRYFTLDASSVVHIDHSDADATVGLQPLDGQNIVLYQPTNEQSSIERIRRSVQSAIDVIR